MGTKISKQKEAGTTNNHANTSNQHEIHPTNVNKLPQQQNKTDDLPKSQQQSTSDMKEIEFVWYHPSFTNSDTVSKSKNTLYKLDLLSIDKIVLYTTRTNKIIWINDLTTIISNYYNPFQLPIKQTITISKSNTIYQLTSAIIKQLQQNNTILDDIYVFGWDSIGYGKALDNTLIINDIDERFTLLLLYNCKPHRLLNKYNITQISNDETKLVNVNISGYNIPLKVILPYERYEINIKHSDLRIILFDLINPYLKNNYNGCNDKDLPFKMDASWAIKMRNNQRNIPNDNEMLCSRAFEFTLRFNINVNDECIMPYFSAKSIPIKKTVKTSVKPKMQTNVNRNVSVKPRNVNSITRNVMLNNNRNCNINCIESDYVMNDEINDNLNAEYSD